jgi:hypothetical protein
MSGKIVRLRQALFVMRPVALRDAGGMMPTGSGSI